MKRTLALLLTLALSLLLFASCGGAEASLVGYYEADGVGYFFAEGGVVVVENGKASSHSFTVNGDTYSLGYKEVNKSALTAASFSAPEAAEEYYTYTTKGAGKYISGLTEAGKAAPILFAPKGVAGLEQGALNGASAKAFVIGKGTAAFNVANKALANCSINLYIDGSCATTDVTCGAGLLEGSNANIYIGTAAYANFKDDYTWGNHSAAMKKF